MKIPVVIVDDEEVDRYLVKRYLEREDDFGELIEMNSGDMFLKKFYGDNSLTIEGSLPLLVLMDINMPGRNGFETAEEAQRLIATGRGPQSLIVMMFTSSNNEQDKSRLDDIEIIKGFVSKPLKGDKINFVRELYASFS